MDQRSTKNRGTGHQNVYHYITYKKDWGSGLFGINFSDLSVAEGEKLATSLHSFYATTQSKYAVYKVILVFSCRNERRKYLKARYWFDCQCMACTQNWPTLSNLPKSPEANGMDVIESFMKLSDVKSAIEALVKMLSDFYNSNDDDGRSKETFIPSEAMVRAEDKLRTCITNYDNLVFGTLMNK